nr:hypothetical protein CFP56_08428 [Quercus suber]
MFNILIGRNIQRNKYALDPISLDNIDLMGDWVAEEPALLNPDDINWDCLNEPVGMVNVEEDAELETIDVDDDDDDEHGLTNLAMGAGLCGAIALGLEIGGLGYLVLAGTMVLSYYSAGLDWIGAVLLDFGRRFSVELVRVRPEALIGG